MSVPAPLAGAAAGLVATAPMTVAMTLLHRLLPWRERYRLPPRRLTDRVTSMLGLRHRLDEEEQTAVTLLAHFGYGAACGALYGPLAKLAGVHGPAVGALFGLAVWTVSYLGWVPAARLMPPATNHPAGRNALMIAAHFVWGAALGWLVDLLAPADHCSASRG